MSTTRQMLAESAGAEDTRLTLSLIPSLPSWGVGHVTLLHTPRGFPVVPYRGDGGQLIQINTRTRRRGGVSTVWHCLSPVAVP